MVGINKRRLDGYRNKILEPHVLQRWKCAIMRKAMLVVRSAHLRYSPKKKMDANAGGGSKTYHPQPSYWWQREVGLIDKILFHHTCNALLPS